MKADFRVQANDLEAVQGAASDLGAELADITQVRGAGGTAWAVFTLATDPFVQGVLLGFLVSRGVTIERIKGGKVFVTITSLKEIREAIKKLL